MNLFCTEFCLSFVLSFPRDSNGVAMLAALSCLANSCGQRALPHPFRIPSQPREITRICLFCRQGNKKLEQEVTCPGRGHSGAHGTAGTGVQVFFVPLWPLVAPLIGPLCFHLCFLVLLVKKVSPLEDLAR